MEYVFFIKTININDFYSEKQFISVFLALKSIIKSLYLYQINATNPEK